MKINCKNCGSDIEINCASELGKQSAAKRDTSSEAMKAVRAGKNKKKHTDT